MRSLFSIVALGFSLLQLTVPTAQCEIQRQLKHDVVDAFKVFRDNDYGVAMFDIDKDGDLDCLTARRTEFDENGPSATYVFVLPGVSGKRGMNITLHLRPGSAPNTPVFTADEGSFQQTGAFFYSDYTTCSVLEIPLQGVQDCMLWVTRDVTDNVPQHCVDEYEDNCDVKNVVYDKDTCSQYVS